MPYRPSLQSAPELRGDIGDPSAWSGSSSSVPTISGTFTGTDSLTYTFTAGGSGTMTIGTTASIPITWSDGTESGRLNLGTDASYTAGDVIPLDKGMSIAFAAGTVIAAETFTLAVVAAYRLRRDHLEIEGDADPVTIDRVSGDLDDGDEYFETDRGDFLRYARAARRDISLDIQHCDESEYYKALRMAHERHPMTVYENYSRDTTILYRGGTADDGEDGLLPVIGPHLTFTRSGVAAYQDAATGLWKHAADGVPRYQYGPETISADLGYEFMRIRDGRPAALGRAITVAKASTNLCPYFHPDSANVRWAPTGGGSSVLTWLDDFEPVLDSSDSTWGDYAKGCVRAYLPAANETIIQDTNASVAGSKAYTAQVWLKGKGTHIVQLWSGPGGIVSGPIGSIGVIFDDGEWHRVAVTGTTAAPDNCARIAIVAGEEAVIYISASQIEEGSSPSGLIKTAGSSASRGAESLILSARPSTLAGTLAMWYWHPGDDGTTDNYYFFRSNGTTLFALRYTPASSVFKFNTASAGALSSATHDMVGSAWVHIAATWEHDGLSTIGRSIYINGQLSASGASSGYWDSTWGNSYVLGLGTAAAPLAVESRIFDLRLESRALSAAEILNIYNRVAQPTERHTYMETAGRRFWFKKLPSKWLDRANPDKMTIGASLYEMGANRDALILPR